MIAKTCNVCGTDISDRGNRAYRCKECQKALRKTSYRQAHIPMTARGKYWKYWKHLTLMKDEELVYLYGTNIKELKHTKTYDAKQHLKTKIKLIGEAFRRRRLNNGF